MISIILTSILTLSQASQCPETKTLNLTSEEWNAADTEALETAQRRCPEVFPEAPCLKLFIKKEVLVYRAICGKTNE